MYLLYSVYSKKSVLVIRLARTGRRNQPKFRVVVAEHSKPVKGKVVEIVGHYNPTVKKDPLTINKEAVESWLGKGTQPQIPYPDF